MNKVKIVNNNDKYRFKLTHEFTNSEKDLPGGSTVNISITIPYNQYKTFHLPEYCSSCPVGYCTKAHPEDEGCGRNVPWTSEDYMHRPDTCRLQWVDLIDIIKENVIYNGEE